ncbi:MAG TPA: hypothetical protein VEG38_14865 [Acidimicrobiia bacterium]|nr:hypothetical protein [Acidimicrobiia bacterium]
MGGIVGSRGRIRRRPAMVGVAGLALLTGYGGMSHGSTYRPDTPEAIVRSLDAINGTLGVPNVVQNVLPGAIAARDVAAAAYRAAGEAADPLSKPEYLVVWAGKMTAGDLSGGTAAGYASSETLSPQAMAELAAAGMKPGLDAMIVVDARRHNADGTPSESYGKVVNFVEVPPPFGIQGEPHHMQYQWEDGQPVVAGGLLNDVTTVWDVSRIPEIRLINVVRPEETPLGSVPDAYDFLPDGRAIGTYMGGPNFNYAGSPGSVVVFRPDPHKGLVFESETPAGSPGATNGSNPGGIPEPCSPVEAKPLGTCANPHGIQIRADLGRMVTADYAEPRELTTDPLKPYKPSTFRPTVRVWDITAPATPRLVSVARMPEGPKASMQGHGNIAIMETAKTHAPAKGFFAGASCGGGIFFAPDVTALAGDSTAAWKQVFDDDMAVLHAPGDDRQTSEQTREDGGCVGGSWHQVSPDNRFLFRTVMGRNPGSTDSFDTGAAKVIYSLDIAALIASAADGHVDCSIDSRAEIRRGQGDEADCPLLVSVLHVEDSTTGGPHWAAVDNHSLAPTGAVTRLVFSNSFVARTGVDGNHRMYMVDVDPATGALSYDESFRDGKDGALGVNFNRRDWPLNPDAGFYKPHAMVWVCPPGVCPG